MRSSSPTPARPDATPSALASLRVRLDPRRHLATAIGWTIVAVVAAASLAGGQLAALDAERATRHDTELLMQQFTRQVQHSLAMSLQTRLAIVQTTADQIAASGEHRPAALRRHLEAVKRQFPEFAWLGVADSNGRIVAASGAVAEGANASGRPWFQAGREHPALADVEAPVLLAPHLPAAPAGRPWRFVSASAPIPQPSAGLGGVVSGHVSWAWIEGLQQSLLAALDSGRPLELLLLNRQRQVIAGPPAWLGRTLADTSDLTEGGRYIVGRHDPTPADGERLGWRVVVRQGAATALKEVERVRRAVLFTVLAAGLLAGLAAWWLTHWLTRRLDVLAGQAHAMRRGQRSSIDVPAGDDEVSRIGATMAALVGQLQHEKDELATLAAELDARVAARTARIERMADEARHAAVTRERLRLARDLHDTLAHSLMALLQQLRLARKLQATLAPQDLAAELERAEAVAAAGLDGARAAITQMRHGTVRVSGLAAALRELLARFGERTGLQAEFSASGPAADLADERAETLYRIVEELLRNIERHAAARTVALSIAGTGARARLMVSDDGTGFDSGAARPGHYGLQGVREQADLIAARLTIESRPGGGTRIELAFDA